MCIELFGIKIRITAAFAVFAAVSANFYDGKMYFLTLVFSLIHEAVHMIMLRFYGCKNMELKLSPGGVRLTAEGIMLLKHKNAFFSAVSAPAANLLLSLLFFLIYSYSDNSLFYSLFSVNFILGAVNLLPLPFLDGGRAVFCILSLFYDERRVTLISDILGVITVIFLFCVLLFAFINGSLSVFFAVFFLYCIVGIVSDKTRQSLT